jgi:hypothetical protein
MLINFCFTLLIMITNTILVVLTACTIYLLFCTFILIFCLILLNSSQDYDGLELYAYNIYDWFIEKNKPTMKLLGVSLDDESLT